MSDSHSLANIIHIRPLCADDLGRIFGERSRPHGEDWLARQSRGEMLTAVAVVEGRPVGRVCLVFSGQTSAGVGLLWAAHVEPDVQSRGIGTALFLHLEQVAREHGLHTIQLDVTKDNTRARRLYERLGYHVCGTEINRWSYREEGRTVEVAEECWLMRKVLSLT
jgi:ribosomal protein S18 acetylase RimI-like enzyme